MTPPPTLQATPSPPDALPADTYPTRHRAWWEACDIIRSQNDHALRVWQTTISAEINAAATAAQDARAKAEQAVAVAGTRAAEAQIAAAAALNAPQPAPSDAALLLNFMHTYISAGAFDTAVLSLAKARLADYKAATYRPPSAPV